MKVEEGTNSNGESAMGVEESANEYGEDLHLPRMEVWQLARFLAASMTTNGFAYTAEARVGYGWMD